MSSKQEALQQLFQDYYIMSVPQFVFALQARTEPDAEVMDIVSDNGYEWDEQVVIFNDHKMQQQIAVLPNGMFIWLYAGQFGKVLKNKEKLALWIGGRGADFIAKFDKITGGATPPDRTSASATEKDLGIPPSVKADSTDILIGKLYRQAGKNKTLPANLMIDLGKKAQKDKDEKLLKFLKTMKPVSEGNIKQSQLKDLVKEIVKAILNEGAMAKVGTDDYDVAVAIAKNKFGKNHEWNVIKNRHTQFGEVYIIENRGSPRLRVIVWKNPENQWKLMNPHTRKWMPVDPFEKTVNKPTGIKTGNPSESMDEMSVAAAAGPVSTPFAFKKTKGMKEGDEADAVNDMWAGSDDDLKQYEVKPEKTGKKVSDKKGKIHVHGKQVNPKDIKETIELTATGAEDDWSRPIYKDQNGTIYVDVNMDSKNPSIHTVSAEGEPELPVRNFKIKQGEQKPKFPNALCPRCKNSKPELMSTTTDGKKTCTYCHWEENPNEPAPLKEITTTGAVDGYNIPGAFAKKGGSKKGVAGSAALGYTLTPIGKKDMEASADKL